MFSGISWQQYLIFLLTANAAYYLFIWIVFYKAKLPVFSGIGRIRTMSLHPEDQPDEIMTTAQHVIDELRPVFNGRSNKNELIQALKSKLRKYNQWDEPGFRETINQYIVAEGHAKCSIPLSEEDQRVLWL